MFAGKPRILNLEKKILIVFCFFKKLNKFMLLYIYLATQNNIILTKLKMFSKFGVCSKGNDVNM